MAILGSRARLPGRRRPARRRPRRPEPRSRDPAQAPAHLPAGRAGASTSTGPSWPRSATRSAATAPAPRSTPPAAAARCRSGWCAKVGLQPRLGADDLGALQGRRRRRRADRLFDPADAIFTAARMMRPVFGARGRLLRRLSPGRLQLLRRLRRRRRQLRRRGDGAGRRVRLPRQRLAAADEPGATEPAGDAAARPAGRARRRGGERQRDRPHRRRASSALTESPPGSNCNPYGPCVEWCSLFVAWVWKRAGVPLEGSTATYAYSGIDLRMGQGPRRRRPARRSAPGESPFSTAEPNGARVLPPTATPAPGDAVLYGSGPTDSATTSALSSASSPAGRSRRSTATSATGSPASGPFLPSQARRATGCRRRSSATPTRRAPRARRRRWLTGFASCSTGRSTRARRGRSWSLRQRDPARPRRALRPRRQRARGPALAARPARRRASPVRARRPQDVEGRRPRSTAPRRRQDPQDEEGSAAARRAARALRSHRALQHVPYRDGELAIALVGARGDRAVLAVSAPTIGPRAAAGGRSCGAIRDTGRAYLARFEATGGHGG